jgi:predicted  nucleic acid-binding Zn-ribbon protein
MKRLAFLLCLSVLLCGCQSMYFGAMEKLGVHKREIMVDRVKAARDAQNAAKTQFVSALQQFKSVVNFKGGDIEKEYDKLSAVLQQSETHAERVHERIDAVENVSKALFSEWKSEIRQYHSDTLRQASQQKLDQTKQRYTELMGAMKRAESKLEPALIPLRDQVLFLKHNLNARAIAGLADEVLNVQTNVDKLIAEIEASVAEADRFIASLQE